MVFGIASFNILDGSFGCVCLMDRKLGPHLTPKGHLASRTTVEEQDLRDACGPHDLNRATQQQPKDHQSLEPIMGSARLPANEISASGAIP